MNWQQVNCPQCGGPVIGTVDTIPGVARLMPDDDGSFDFDGDTDINWNAQETNTNASGEQELTCGEGHTWFSQRIDEADDATNTRVCVEAEPKDKEELFSFIRLHGGSFFSALAYAWQLGDEQNRAKIEVAWSDVIADYRKAMKAKGQTTP